MVSTMAARLAILLLTPCALASEGGVLRKLTECQKCCLPGGDCSKASHQQPGKCCGAAGGNNYCCPSTASCWACANSYRCYDGRGRPSSTICAHEGGEAGSGEVVTFLIMLISLIMCACAFSACMRHQRSVPLAAQQGLPMPPAMYPQMAMPTAVVRNGQPAAGVPVAQAVPACPQQVAVQGGYPVYQQGGYPVYHQSGYSGGSVAMGAGMGFLGGMMMGDMLADAGHHGGDYGGGGDFGGGGGGDFAADM